MRLHLTERITVESGGRTLGESDLPGGQGRLVLACLALRHDRPVPSAELGTLLWPDRLPKAWEKALAAVVSKLRTALAGIGLDGREIITNAFGCYQVNLPAGAWLDTDAVADEVVAAEASVAAGDTERAAASGTTAAALARRSFLPGHDCPWVDEVRAGRKALLVRAIDVLAWSLPAPGSVAAAEEAIALEPFREPGWIRLMSALAAGGDRAEALRAYERCRALLADELGIDPSAATQEVYLALLREDREPSFEPGSPQHSIPIARTPLVGRGAEIEQIAAALEAPGIVTLIGPGGSGKTRLACEVALRTLPRYAGGSWFADLGPLRDPAVVPFEIARAVGVETDAVGDPVAAIAARVKDALLVVDNCEHVLDAVRDVLAAIAVAAPDARILATSRQALDVPTENALQVAPLATPGQEATDAASIAEVAAVRLFCDRATYARADFALTDDNAPAVARICRRLDGLPLALELAAARIRVLSADQIERRLDGRFRLLTRAQHAVPDRQQSLEAAIAWSVELLSDAQRTLLTRMTLFPAGCTLDAVEAVCTGGPVEPHDVLDLLQELADRSLVTATGDPDGVRYRMLETIRAYAATLLSPEDADVYGARQIAWLAALAERAAPHLLGHQQAAWLDRLGREHDNLRDALGRAVPVDRLRIAVDLERFWMLRGFWQESKRRITAALADADDDAPAPLRSRALAALAYLGIQQGEPEAAGEAAARAAEIARTAGARKELAYALLQQASAVYIVADLGRAEELFAEALALCKEVGDRRGVGIVASNLGAVWHDRGHLEKAERYYLEGVEIDRELGNLDDVGQGLANLGSLAFDRDDLEGSERYYREALGIQRPLGTPAIVPTLHGLARHAVATGDLDAAPPLIAECRALAEELGHRIAVMACIELTGAHAFRSGDLDVAAARYDEAIAGYDDISLRPQLSSTLLDAAEVEAARGRTDVARAYLERSIEIAAETGNTHVGARAHTALAALS